MQITNDNIYIHYIDYHYNNILHNNLINMITKLVYYLNKITIR